MDWCYGPVLWAVDRPSVDVMQLLLGKVVRVAPGLERRGLLVVWHALQRGEEAALRERCLEAHRHRARPLGRRRSRRGLAHHTTDVAQVLFVRQLRRLALRGRRLAAAMVTVGGVRLVENVAERPVLEVLEVEGHVVRGA